MKIASRYLLPLEMFMAVALLSWGLTGWVGVRDPLYLALAHLGQNHEWGVWLCGIAIAQLAVSGLEWLAGRRWTAPRLLAVVRARCALSLMAAVAWFYACYFMLVTPDAGGLVPLLIQALAGGSFAVWALLENLKTAALLDPQVPTTRLQGMIIADRRKALEG